MGAEGEWGWESGERRGGEGARGYWRKTNIVTGAVPQKFTQKSSKPTATPKIQSKNQNQNQNKNSKQNNSNATHSSKNKR